MDESSSLDGEVVQYTVTPTNASPVVTHPLLTARSPGTGISLASAHWFCTNIGGGSGCSGPFRQA